MWDLSSREIATSFWLAAFLAWGFTHPPVRSSFLNVIKALFASKVIIPIMLVIGYTSAVVWGLAAIGFWDASLLKDTVLWFLLAGIVAVFSGIGGKEDERLFHLMVVENLKVLVLIEFLINFYTFHILIEFILIPFIAVIAMMDVVAEQKPEHQQVSRFLKSVQAITGLAILYFVFSEAIGDYRAIGTLDTLRQVLLPAVLSILLLPAAFALRLYSVFELLFVRFRMGPDKSQAVSRYGKLKLIAHIGPRPRAARAFLRRHALDLMRVRSKEDIDRLFRSEREG